MPNAYETAQSLGLTGTADAIVALLKPLTARNITVSDAVDWLAEGGYWQETPGGMTGTLVAVYAASTGAQRKKFDDVWLWLFGANAPTALKTTKPSQADRVQFLINQIPGLTAQIKNTFWELGNGQPFKTLTAIEYTSQETAAATAATLAANIAAVETEWATHMNERINPAMATGDRLQLIAAVRASLVIMEAV